MDGDVLLVDVEAEPVSELGGCAEALEVPDRSEEAAELAGTLLGVRLRLEDPAVPALAPDVVAVGVDVAHPVVPMATISPTSRTSPRCRMRSTLRAQSVRTM